MTGVVQNYGNTSSGNGGGDIPPGSLPQATPYYETHKPRPQPPKTVLSATPLRVDIACSVCGQDSDDLVDDVCPRCRAVVAGRFETPTELPAAPEAEALAASDYVDGEPADDNAADGPAAAPSSRPAPSAENDGYQWPAATQESAPAWHGDVLQLLIDTEGHPDPFIKAARKVVANGLVALAKAHRATTQAPAAAGFVVHKRRQRTTIDAAQVVELYAGGEGLSPPEIGRRLGHTAKVIRHALDVAGVQRVDGRATHSGGRKKTAADDDPVVVEKLRALYVDQGQTLEQIAAEVDGSVKLVTNILKRAGVKLRPSASAAGARRAPLTDEERAAICRRYAAGEEGPALADVFNVGRTVIYASLRAAGVPVRPRGAHHSKGSHV